MLDQHFNYPGVLQRMRVGPFKAEIDRVANDLERAGYTYLSAKRYLSLIASFSHYALQSGCTRVQSIDRALLERFLRRRSWSRSTAIVARSALGHVLRNLGPHTHAVRPSPSERRDAVLLGKFDTYHAMIVVWKPSLGRKFFEQRGAPSAGIAKQSLTAC
jgi:hypothetical protein